MTRLARKLIDIYDLIANTFHTIKIVADLLSALIRAL